MTTPPPKPESADTAPPAKPANPNFRLNPSFTFVFFIFMVKSG